MIGKSVKINRGPFRDCVGTVEHEFDYHGQKMYTVFFYRNLAEGLSKTTATVKPEEIDVVQN